MLTRRSFIDAGLSGAALLAIAPAWPRSPNPAEWSLQEAAGALRQGSVSPTDLTRACLARIDALNPRYNAFITVTAEQALTRARELEKLPARDRSPSALFGIPLALKDNIDTAGVRTTAAAAALAERVPAEDAAVVERLKSAGSVLLGKLNMDEFAYGVSSTTGHFGAVRNPWAPDFIAGGSSGGPAAAVAARLCYGALGTDTGGSIRQPAAWCGITGLKPTYGLVSARGVIPLSWSLDHVGPMCRSAADAALLLQAIAGYDAADPASFESSAVDYPGLIARRVGKLRLGLPRKPFFEDLDPEIARATENALQAFEDLTAGTRDIELPAVPALALLFVEAATDLGTLLEPAPQLVSPAMRSLIDMGKRISASTYAQARRELVLIRRRAAGVFDDVDLLIVPTTPNLPVSIEASRIPEQRRGPPLSARNTTPFNIFGLPAISVPCGFSRTGLPIGLQIVGPPSGDALVLTLAHAWQQHTDWHRKSPP